MSRPTFVATGPVIFCVCCPVWIWNTWDWASLCGVWLPATKTTSQMDKTKDGSAQREV